jgi:branched-chain amino acid aminotransferase
MYAYIHPEIIPLANATLHVSDLSIQRGYGIFDFCKIKNGHIYFLNDYLDRFYQSAATMRLPVPLDRSDLAAMMIQLIRKNNIAESGLKVILTGGYSADGFQPGTPNLLLLQSPLTIPPQEQLLKGYKVITHEYVRDVPGVKTINYTTGIWLLEKMRQESADEVLYHSQGNVSEFPRSNFFIVTKDDQVITASSNVLKGVTRKNVLKLASSRFKTVEGNIALEDVYKAKEAFLTSTTKRIVPVIEVDHNVIGTGKAGEVSKILLNDLIALEEEDQMSKKTA